MICEVEIVVSLLGLAWVEEEMQTKTSSPS